MRFVCCFSWGVWTGYFGRSYLPTYDFSGGVALSAGELLRVERIRFAQDGWGPFIKSAAYEPMEGTSFDSVLCNTFDGVRVTCEMEETDTLTLSTAMGELSVTPRELRRRGYAAKEVGERCSMAVLLAELDEAWYLEAFPPEERIRLADDFPGQERRDWFGVRGVLLPPGGTLRWEEPGGPPPADAPDSALMRVRLRTLINGEDDREAAARGVPRLLLEVNGHQVWGNVKFSMFHDVSSQFLDEQFIDVPVHACREEGQSFVLTNADDQLRVLVQLVGVSWRVREHMSIRACPAWGLAGQTAAITLSVTQAALVDIEVDETLAALAVCPETVSPRPFRRQLADLNRIGVNECALRALPAGDHTFSLVLRRPTANLTVRFTDRWSGRTVEAVVREVWPELGETHPVKIGVELQTGTPSAYIPLIERVRDERLGNLVVFRDYHNDSGQPDALWEAAAFCRHYGLYTDAIIMDEQATVARSAGEHALAVGTHEHTGIFYGRDRVGGRHVSMKEAQEEAVADLREVADALRLAANPEVPVAIGDASGGSRYAYMAGFDCIRHETFVGHHLLILPNARGAARAYGREVWGAHVASHHNALPELGSGLRRFWLGMALPWVMGANFVFEEDSLFSCFTYKKMTGRDYMPAGKQAVNRWLYKHAATHPRVGEPLVDIGVIQGRYAPPISGLSVANNGDAPDGALTDENYPVWSHTGRPQWEWGYRQCEKGLHLLETLAPRIFLTPLRQETEKVRKFFSGTPKGEFDFLPVEAPADTLARYTLLLFLDWHTMDEERDDYARLLAYARQGGAVFLSVPQFTTRSDRDFLRDMEDLRLYRGGAVEDLCGVRIEGKSGTVFSGAVWEPGWEPSEETRDAYARSIRRPNTDEREDGPCRLASVRLAGARVLARDAVSGLPLLVGNPVGEGVVYLLCAYAYPGHEALKEFCFSLVDRLTSLHRRGRIRCTGDVRDVYYSVWGEENEPETVYLLNTDWTEPGGGKEICLQADGLSMDIRVREGQVTEAHCLPAGILLLENTEGSLTLLEKSGSSRSYRLSAFDQPVLRYALRGGAVLRFAGREIAVGERGRVTAGTVALPIRPGEQETLQVLY